MNKMQQYKWLSSSILLIVYQGRLAVSSVVLGLLLSACAVGPNYNGPPNIELNKLHNAQAVEGLNGNAASPPLDAWWTGFNDPELTKVIQRALLENLDLKASVARVEQARAVARAAGAKLLPTIGAYTQVTGLHMSQQNPIYEIGAHLPDFDKNVALYDAGLSASWEIDLAGGLQRNQEAASSEAQAANAQHLGVRVIVAANAADAYFQIRGYQARLKYAQEQVQTDEHLLELINLRKSYGVATDLEIAQAEALLRNARATIPPLRIALEAQLNRLDVLMGAQPGTYAEELKASSEIATIPHISASVLVTDLLHRRPDILAAERKLAASNANIGVAVSDYYPKISLSALLGFESMKPGQLFKATTFQPAAVGGLRWRLFDFGKVDAEVAHAKGANAEALVTYRQTVLRATEDVENAFMSLAQQEIRMNELAKEETALLQARDIAQENYKAGTTSLTDVLDANRQLLAARDQLAQTRSDTARAAVASFRALGGGW
jgi:NodT family efflux transporter outer membrane factor (OMF) lipoprotein